MCDCEEPDFYCNVVVKARKPHRCYECHRTIEPGMRYHRLSGKWNGDIESYSVCRWCESIRAMWYEEKAVECKPCIGGLYQFMQEELIWGGA